MTVDAVLDQRRFGAGPEPEIVRRTARVLLVDAEAIVRFGLRQLLAGEIDLTVVGEAATARDALLIADRSAPDVVVLDVDLGRGDTVGVEVARALLERRRGVRVLVLTSCRDREVMLRTVRLGVHGYLRKGADTADIVRAVRAVLRGESVFDSRSGSVVMDVPRDGDRGERPRAQMLTERENQVLKLLAVGMSNREIGRRLLISEATVKFHVRNLRDKLEVRRRTEIVYTATRQGMV
ncbi:LuxR C-terminal-related transcriptional regulator [Pseudonocardia acidicola]|uniref:Response regulator transcription factor n=1 Tax=Pseudonocardia acidicola TaxID=2724939 RepID=A0ABX1S6K0_9PSEU|nr:response regulator transcription factor [Pseudonocardia acidicola]NMH97179.1 response regulator transcription factor [Pseudonocardia acidicola]